MRHYHKLFQIWFLFSISEFASTHTHTLFVGSNYHRPTTLSCLIHLFSFQAKSFNFGLELLCTHTHLLAMSGLFSVHMCIPRVRICLLTGSGVRRLIIHNNNAERQAYINCNRANAMDCIKIQIKKYTNTHTHTLRIQCRIPNRRNSLLLKFSLQRFFSWIFSSASLSEILSLFLALTLWCLLHVCVWVCAAFSFSYFLSFYLHSFSIYRVCSVTFAVSPGHRNHAITTININISGSGSGNREAAA